MRQLDVHFLQTRAWQRFQESLRRQTVREHGDGWEYLAIVESGRGNRRLYCPYGPTVRDAMALQEAITSLRAQAKRLSCDFIRVEPIGNLSKRDLVDAKLIKAKRNVQPAHTWCVDVSPSADEIIAQMSATTRNLHRNIAPKGLTITSSHNPQDIDKLLKLLEAVAKHNGITVHSDTYLRKQAEILLPSGDASLYLAWFAGGCIAAALVYDSATTRYYAHAAADYEHRKLQAGTPLVSTMILDAKDRGLKTFDLYGVAPPDQPNHPWAGFTKFKQAFGGQSKDYLGTWELPLKPLKYRLYHHLQKAKY